MHVMLLISIPPNYWRKRLTKKANYQFKMDLVNLVYQRAIPIHHGDVQDPKTWMPVAWGLNCETSLDMIPYGDPEFFRGRYTPADPHCFNGEGLIECNTAIPPPQQARVLVHEIGHHLLWPILSGNVFGAQTCCYYDDSPLDFRHSCCCLLEEMVFGEFPPEAGVSELIRRYGVKTD